MPPNPYRCRFDLRERRGEPHVGKWTAFAENPRAEGRPPSIVICTYGAAAAAYAQEKGGGGKGGAARSRLIDWGSVSTLVVDETSQLWAGAALGLLCRLPAVRHWVFVGDEHQLPPFGYAEVPGLSSLFDAAKSHPDVPTTTLTDTYRLPPAVGTLISRHVYASELKVCNRALFRHFFDGLRMTCSLLRFPLADKAQFRQRCSFYSSC
jgi:hypothetical protein